MTSETEDRPRPAATLLLVRRHDGQTSVLMGQRGASAVFMPSKYVFPGGGVDADDADIPLLDDLDETCLDRLAQHAEPGLGPRFAAAAARELWEETGLILGAKATWQGEIPESWRDFAKLGYRPRAAALRFFFRAITPPGRPRRFDARFFLADAADLVGDPDDFSRASDELSHLHWVALAEARRLNLPFITEVVLAELTALLAGTAEDSPLPLPASVPFFDNSGPVPMFRRLV